LPLPIRAVFEFFIAGFGIAGIYNRSTYDAEKRQALDMWAAHVEALIEGRKSTVVAMKRA
jgi:hypothetical protein